MSQLNQQQQQQQPLSNKHSQQSSRLGSPKKVLIYTGESYLRPSSQQQQDNNNNNNSIKSSHSPSLQQQNTKSAGKSILKPIRLSIDPDKPISSGNNVNNYPHHVQKGSNSQLPYTINQTGQHHSRAQSETGKDNFTTFHKPSGSYLMSPDNQFVSPPKTEKKPSGFIQLQSMNTTHRDITIQPKIQLNTLTANTPNNTRSHLSNRLIEPNNDNSSAMLVLSPLRQKNKNLTGEQNTNTRTDSAMISVNDRIPFKISNGVSLLNKGNQEVLPLKNDYEKQIFNTKSHYNNTNNNNSIIDNAKNNYNNYKNNNSNSILSIGQTLSSDGDKQTAQHSIQHKETFQHTGSYLKRRLQQIDQNQLKPINQLPLVNEDTTAETIVNPSEESIIKYTHNISQVSPPIVTQFRVDGQQQNSPEDLSQQVAARNSPSSIINQPQQRAQASPASISSNGTSLISNIPPEYDATKMRPPNPPFPFPPSRRLHSQSDQGRHPYETGNDTLNNGIIPTDAEVNRRKHRLLERLKNPNNSPPNKFHYSEHYQDQTEDEIANLSTPPGITHPLRNLYDHKNPLRMFQIRNNIPLANQKIIADPETYTHQLFCHANVKRQKNQERVINLLEEQDQMMGRLIGKYKKRADQEEAILSKKLDQLEKEKNSLVHLKIQEHKLGQLQNNLTSKLGQFKQNVGFYNAQMSPSIPALRPDMYDQCSDMYDLAFMDSILRQDQKRYGRVKQRQGLAGANSKHRSKSVLE